MHKEFSGKVAVVTGGTSGLGKGISKAFLEQGATVIALYKENDEKASEVSKTFSKTGNFKAIKVDVGNELRMIEVFNDIPQIDFLINCAGVSYEDDINKLTMEQVKAVYDTQVFGKIIACRCAFDKLLKSESPSIVNLASRFATRPLIGAIPLTSSEAAIVMLTKNLALEWSKYNIRVNCVSPSLTIGTGSYYAFYTDDDAYVQGQKNPLGRIGRPEDTANAVLFLCSEKSNYITGENLNVNGGILLI